VRRDVPFLLPFLLFCACKSEGCWWVGGAVGEGGTGWRRGWGRWSARVLCCAFKLAPYERSGPAPPRPRASVANLQVKMDADAVS